MLQRTYQQFAFTILAKFTKKSISLRATLIVLPFCNQPIRAVVVLIMQKYTCWEVRSFNSINHYFLFVSSRLACIEFKTMKGSEVTGSVPHDVQMILNENI